MMDEIEALAGRHWVLDGHRAVRATLHEWGRMFDTPDARTVAKDEIGQWSVSTVFLGVDHRMGEPGPPLLFETMIFSAHDPRHENDESTWRYSTWEQAEDGHRRVSDAIRSGADLPE